MKQTSAERNDQIHFYENKMFYQKLQSSQRFWQINIPEIKSNKAVQPLTLLYKYATLVRVQLRWMWSCDLLLCITSI